MRPLLLATLLAASSAAAQSSYVNFEAGHVRPLAMSADGTRLYAVNTPDDRLEIFDLTAASPTHLASVPVGMSPVAVAVESPSRVWVVNHLSDSVSIVDVASSPPRVVRTLLVGDEPGDIVFALRRAFVTTAHRGQSHPVPRGDYAQPGIGRADVWVFDADALGAPLGGTPLTIVQLFGDVPRALAVTPDGSRVYAAVFLSGNGTTTINEGLVCDGGPTVAGCTFGGTAYPGGLPAPVRSADGSPAPEVGLIVRRQGAEWLDELGRDWSMAVRFELPDRDVFAIDAQAATPSVVGDVTGVGSVLFSMAVNPATGSLYVANTEALNHVRFEGPGRFVREQGLREGQPASVRGHLHEARISVVDPGGTRAVHLNPHIDYDAERVAPGTRERTIATPLGMVVSSDGATVYLAVYGSSAVAVIPASELASGTVSTEPSRLIELRDAGPVGPTGLALDEARGRLYVMTRFDDSIRTVDLASRSVTARARLHTPEPAETIQGRPMLYDARFTSTNGEASCGSCHVFGDLDGLGWDLGDPDAEVLPNQNPIGVIGARVDFHPMKGPMTTQSLRGMSDHGPMHWRGDRSGGNDPGGDALDELAAFERFNGAFPGLLGREEGTLRPEEMRRFAEFALGIHYPPNPIRQLDNSLRPDEARGEDLYFNRDPIDSVTTCNGCHVLDRARGFFGGDGRTTFEGETQQFKVPHLRNAYQKVGMFGMPAAPFFLSGDNGPMGPQVRGFGYLHDGSCDTLMRFFHAGVFSFNGDAERRDVEAFTMAFDSNLAPIVGQQVTLDASSDASVEARIDLMIARAQAPLVQTGGAMTTECDLVVHGVEGGRLRGWLFESGAFTPDRAADGPVADADLRAIGRAGSLTYTCMPPGSGRRAALDRDEDGALDGDDAEPAARAEIAIPDPQLPMQPMADGGVVEVDAGVRTDAGPPVMDAGIDAGGPPPMSGGCGCRASAAPGAGGSFVAMMIALVIRRRRPRCG